MARTMRQTEACSSFVRIQHGRRRSEALFRFVDSVLDSLEPKFIHSSDAGEKRMSRTQRMLEKECLFFINPVWSSEMMLGIIDSSRKASALARIL